MNDNQPATLLEAAYRLKATGQDPVRWLNTLAELEEALSRHLEKKTVATASVVRAIREAHVWCAPSVLLLVGRLRDDIARRRTAEDESPPATRRALRYRPSADERDLRRIVDAIAEPGSDVRADDAEQIRLDYLALEIRRYVESRTAAGATRRQAMTDAARVFHFGARSRRRPGWEAVERFLLRRRPKKSTDISRPAPNVGATKLETHPALRSPRPHGGNAACLDRNRRRRNATAAAPGSTWSPSSPAGQKSPTSSDSRKASSERSRPGASAPRRSASKEPDSSYTTSVHGSRGCAAVPPAPRLSRINRRRRPPDD